MSEKKILVVDDRDNVRVLAARVLHGVGHSTIEATDGLAAVEIAAGTTLDLVVSDIEMPRMNGIEAAVQMRLRDPNLPILLASGNYNIIEQYKRSHPQFQYLEKPYKPGQLLEIVNDLLATRTYI